MHSFRVWSRIIRFAIILILPISLSGCVPVAIARWQIASPADVLLRAKDVESIRVLLKELNYRALKVDTNQEPALKFAHFAVDSVQTIEVALSWDAKMHIDLVLREQMQKELTVLARAQVVAISKRIEAAFAKGRITENIPPLKENAI
jgi:hypothetical protein